MLRTVNGGVEGSLSFHDEILLEVLIEATDEVVPILKERMEQAGRTLLKTIPVEAEVFIVDSRTEK